jgi:site-specific recombinase XerD
VISGGLGAKKRLRLLGDKSIETTEVCTHVAVAELAHVIRRGHPRGRERSRTMLPKRH